MKKLALILVMFITGLVSAQTSNQFDAEGKRHGIWKKYFDDTAILRYEGEFNHGKEIGLFKYYKNLENKASLTATKQFNDSDNKSYATFFTSAGKIVSEGQMDGKIYIGVWKYYQKNSNELLILENYDEHGELDGDRFVYYENGQIAEKQFYRQGKLEGSSFWYTDKNVVLKEFHYVNGELHGLAKSYDPKGQLILEGQYKKGKKDGIWKTYENGKLTEEKDFTYHSKLKKNN